MSKFNDFRVPLGQRVTLSFLRRAHRDEESMMAKESIKGGKTSESVSLAASQPHTQRAAPASQIIEPPSVDQTPAPVPLPAPVPSMNGIIPMEIDVPVGKKLSRQDTSLSTVHVIDSPQNHAEEMMSEISHSEASSFTARERSRVSRDREEKSFQPLNKYWQGRTETKVKVEENSRQEQKSPLPPYHSVGQGGLSSSRSRENVKDEGKDEDNDQDDDAHGQGGTATGPRVFASQECFDRLYFEAERMRTRRMRLAQEIESSKGEILLSSSYK